VQVKIYPRVVISSLVTALVVLLGACAPSATTSTSTNLLPSAPVEFEIHGGVEDYFDELDTLIVIDFKFQNATNEQNVPFELVGPVGWNEGKPHKTMLERTLPNNDRWWLNLDAAVVGTYKATVQVNGKSYTSSVDIDGARRLPVATISVSSASANRVDASWVAVPGAKQYYVTLYDEDTVFYYFYTEEASISFTDFEEPLDTTKQFYVGVEAFSERLYDLSENETEQPVLPAHVNASYTDVPVKFPVDSTSTIAATVK
jgi:hypothetical protein